MSNQQRDIETLLMDYADALRDGAIPVFLKSLSKVEAHTVEQSQGFPEALEIVRLLNEIHFAEKAMRPDVGLFISRVNAEIASRMKKANMAPRQRKRSRATRHVENL